MHVPLQTMLWMHTRLKREEVNGCKAWSHFFLLGTSGDLFVQDRKPITRKEPLHDENLNAEALKVLGHEEANTSQKDLMEAC